MWDELSFFEIVSFFTLVASFVVVIALAGLAWNLNKSKKEQNITNQSSCLAFCDRLYMDEILTEQQFFRCTITCSRWLEPKIP